MPHIKRRRELGARRYFVANLNRTTDGLSRNAMKPSYPKISFPCHRRTVNYKINALTIDNECPYPGCQDRYKKMCGACGMFQKNTAVGCSKCHNIFSKDAIYKKVQSVHDDDMFVCIF